MKKNCLSYWFPKLKRSGVPVPQTSIIHAQGGDLESVLDGKPSETLGLVSGVIQIAAADFGYPVFLRTGMGSGKHRWDETCFIKGPECIASHVAALVEWSHLVDFFGLPHDVWVVREYLPVEPIATLYRGMPLVRETRAFISGGVIKCIHPYWPIGAIREGIFCEHMDWPDDECAVCNAKAGVYFAAADMTSKAAEVRALLEVVAKAFADDGAWSVDVIDTKRGLFVTDMAEAARSFHYEGCSNKFS